MSGFSAMTSKRRILWVSLLISAILAPFILFSTPMRTWTTASPVATIMQDLMWPFVYGWNLTADFASRQTSRYLFLSGAAAENERLRAELAEQKARHLDYEEQVQQTSRLRELLGFAKRYERKMLVAEVIGSNTRAPFKSLRVARGRADGVRVGMPVVAADGIVGRVVRVGSRMSDLQLLVDFDFNLDVLLQRTRVRGVIGGYQGEHARLSMQKGTEVRIGDTIITSGIVGGFPKGLPVGRVMRISYESDNVSQVITVEPWVDYRRLEEVMILFETDPELQKLIDIAGPQWLDKTLDNASGG